MQDTSIFKKMEKSSRQLANPGPQKFLSLASSESRSLFHCLRVAALCVSWSNVLGLLTFE